MGLYVVLCICIEIDLWAVKHGWPAIGFILADHVESLGVFGWFTSCEIDGPNVWCRGVAEGGVSRLKACCA